MIWFILWLASAGLIFPALGPDVNRITAATLLWAALGLFSLFIGPWLLIVGVIGFALLFWASRQPAVQHRRHARAKAETAQAMDRINTDLSDRMTADIERDFATGVIDQDEYDDRMADEEAWLANQRPPT